MDWIEEILSWPASWSALHGIAEVKTPVLKVSTRTDATAHEFVVRRHGRGMPAEAAPAWSFRSTARAARRDAFAGVRAKGLEAPIAPHTAPPEWYAIGQRIQLARGDGRGASADRGAGRRHACGHRDRARSRVRQRRAAQEDLRSRGRTSSRSAWTSRNRSSSTRGSCSRTFAAQLRRRQHVRRHSARRRHGLQPDPADARTPARSR